MYRSTDCSTLLHSKTRGQDRGLPELGALAAEALHDIGNGCEQAAIVVRHDAPCDEDVASLIGVLVAHCKHMLSSVGPRDQGDDKQMQDGQCVAKPLCGEMCFQNMQTGCRVAKS